MRRSILWPGAFLALICATVLASGHRWTAAFIALATVPFWLLGDYALYRRARSGREESAE